MTPALLFRTFPTMVVAFFSLLNGCEPCVAHPTDEDCYSEEYDLGDTTCHVPEPCCVDSTPDDPCDLEAGYERIGTYCCKEGRTP